MRTGRFVGAALAVWIVRTVLNWLFYGQYMAELTTAVSAQWEGAFRQVVPAYILTDLLFALVFVWLWTRVGSAFAAGAKGGAGYGVVIGLLAAVIPSIYHFYSVTYITYPTWVTEIVYQLVAHAILGVVAALVYRSAGSPPAAA